MTISNVYENLRADKKVKLHNSNLPNRRLDERGESNIRLAMSQNIIPEDLEPSNFPIIFL
jgi:hypothetical protein